GGTMRYDKEFFVVKPGSKVKLVLNNTDLMPHNLIVCAPGKNNWLEVAQAAWKLGAAGPAKHYIPADKRVLHHTKLLQPGESEAIYFKAPTTETDHPYVCTFPGHAYAMKGIMRVSKNLDQKNPNAKIEKPTKGLRIGDAPYVYRTNIKGLATHTLCVGTPRGMHFAFNPQTCTLARVWTGDFIDASRDQKKRGGGGSRILGQVFYDGGKTFPIRIGSTPAKEVTYRGHRLSSNGYPTFLYDVDGVRVRHSIAPDPSGKRLSQWFDLKLPSARTVAYVADAPEKTDSLSGEFKDGKLSVDRAKHIRFEVGVKP
ncbi:MAG: plastocyanin/azurin family copper-binding protein, partial [Phycisphaeraceae bacterium]|nr:plastocyanin/azurin family copper-binding protein [Phycisphaeraceae bacterium]